MRAFVIHRNSNSLGEKIDKIVTDAGFDLLTDDLVQSRNSVKDIIDQYLVASDLIVVVLTAGFAESKLGDLFLRALTIQSDFGERKRIILFMADSVGIPFDLGKYEQVFAYRDLQGGLEHLKRILVSPQKDDPPLKIEAFNSDKSREHIKTLNKAYTDGTLTLVCGAGVSVDAQLPDWNKLLDRLLKILTAEFGGHIKDPKFDLSDLKSNSTLVLGQYIKNTLDDRFLQYVRSALYESDDVVSELVSAICELARPKRNQLALDSIINFNFDDVLERAFGNEIHHKAIFEEGQLCPNHELPIYHVHGYLPKNGKPKDDKGIVFSEDAYHDQFIDPFGWANLTQLNKFSQNTCLFVGLSLTDPNLRRLLDVSKRKNTSVDRRHFMISKKSGDSDDNQIIDNLRATDAGILGINTIYVDDYKQIPKLIRQVAGTATSS